jgi:membrane protease YdiL (CAAX protease family)
MIASVAILATVLVYTWVAAPITPRSMATVAGAIVIAIAIARALKTREWGLAPAAFLPSLGLAAVFTASASAALAVAALHLPNPFLTLGTFVAAVAWCWIYERHPNVVPLALSHAALTLVILCVMDDAMTGRLRVGVAYLAGR